MVNISNASLFNCTGGFPRNLSGKIFSSTMNSIIAEHSTDFIGDDLLNFRKQ